MEILVGINRWLHIIVGFAGLVAWWVPLLTTKGSGVHKRLGKVFVLAALIVGTTAVLSTPLRVTQELLNGVALAVLVPGIGFLLFLSYLGVLTLNMAYFGVRVLRTRREPARLDTPMLRVLSYGLIAAAVVVVVHALVYWSGISIIMLILGPLGVVGGIDQLRYLKKSAALKKPWFYAHMDAMLGAGVAFHTAFLVFGSRVVLDLSVFGDYNWVPWVLPGAVGAIGGGAWKRAYMRRFGDLPRPEVAATS